MEKKTIINETNLSSVPPTKDLGNEFVSELNKLSIKERDEVNHDLHGVSSVSKEDPDFIHDSLQSFESELRAIHAKEKEAYLSACGQSTEYVTDKKNLLMLHSSHLSEI